MEHKQRNNIFISYSHKDKQWLDLLNDFLKPLVRDSDFIIWDDTKIRPGQQWKEEIINALNSSKVAILLVSQHFIASDFIYNEELPPIFEAAKTDQIQIFWIHVSFSTYSLTPLKDFQAANNPSKPLDSLSSHKLSEALVSICKKIELAFKGDKQNSAESKSTRNGNDSTPEIAPDDW